MSDHSAIEWTDATWNPTTGCTKVSPGCAHCYIERTAAFRMTRRKFDANGHITLQLHADRLDQPLHWKKPRRVFVNSLSDLFHEDVPYHHISFVWRAMQRTPHHTYQILTKRPERLHEEIPKLMHTFGVLPNVWLGVSVENQHFADERIPLLLQTPAAVRFISAEPLLGPLDLCRLHLGVQHTGWGPRLIARDALTPWETQYHGTTETRGLDSVNRGTKLDWVIVGGESGPGARPFDLAWARSIIEQCRVAGVPVFVKQLGAKPFDWHDAEPTGRFRTDPTTGRRQLEVRSRRIVRDRKGGNMAEWPMDLRVRQWPVAP